MNKQHFNPNITPQLPEDKFEPIPPKEFEQKVLNQAKEFDALLHSLDSSLDKKKTLWKQIYENAIQDRKNAYLVFADLYSQVHGKANEHAIHGQTISKYLERVSKSTDQLIRLAELVAAAEDKVKKEDGGFSDDALYSQMNPNLPSKA